MNTSTSHDEPQVGQVWQYNDGSPWPSPFPPVRITGAADGWVRYESIGYTKPDDRRTQLATFLQLYKPFIPRSYAEAVLAGAVSWSEPLNTVCGVCGSKHCGCIHNPRDRRADLGSKVGR
jgi:hypothetical protein